MDDRELLELAAKAAGMRPLLCYEARRNCLRIGTRDNYVLWRPLTDDGDALRLAVKLKIDFKAYDKTVRTWVGDPVAQAVIASVEELCGTAPYFATRRAIVRAAAEIGKQVKDNDRG